MLAPTLVLLFGRMTSLPIVDYLAVGLYIIDSLGEAPAALAPPSVGLLSCTGLMMFELEMTDGW